MRRERIVIVGAGPAGVAAAVQCGRLGVIPLILDTNGHAGGLVANAWRIENLPGVEPLDGQSMAARLRRHLETVGMEVEQATVERVRPADAGFVIHGTSTVIEARAVILAVGTRPVPLGIPGVHAANGVFYEVRTLLRHHPSPQSVIVVGGGEAALDSALSLAEAGACVSVVVRGKEPKACQRLLDEVRGNARISIIPGASPVRYAEGQGGVRLEVCSSHGTDVLCATTLLVAIGRVSTVPEILGELASGVRHGLLQPFPDQALFVAGDARHGRLGQLAMAFGDGVAAAGRAISYVTGAS